MSKVKLSIGDWSEDGHNQYVELVFNTNKSVEEIRQAYKDSCKVTGLQFNHNEDYTGLNLSWPENKSHQLLVEYEDNIIALEAFNKLVEFGIFSGEEVGLEEEGFYIDNIDQFVEVWIKFVKLSLPDLELEEASYKRSELKDIPPINGWWNESLNVQFGYGLFE